MENHVGKRILIVDNDELVLCALECLLETIGYETETAWSGAQAMEFLRSQPFDLVLLDDQLCDTDALELLQQLQPMHPLPPLVVTQNIPFSQRAAQCYLGLGAAAVVAKSDLEEIGKVVATFAPLARVRSQSPSHGEAPFARNRPHIVARKLL